MELGRLGPMMMSAVAGAASYGVSFATTRSATARWGWLRRALSPTFPAGEMVFFIPWRVVAEESGAAPFDFGAALILALLIGRCR
jgi:hypothetical protein